MEPFPILCQCNMYLPPSVIGLLSVYLNIQEVRDDLHFVYLLIFSPVNSDISVFSSTNIGFDQQKYMKLVKYPYSHYLDIC